MPARRLGKRDSRRRGRRPPGTYERLLNGIPDPEDMEFGGSTYDPELDQYRLGTQLQDVWAYIQDEEWHDPEEMEKALGHRWASISARLRDFRKSKFGGHDIERERIADGGSWRYRLVRPLLH